MTITKRIGAYDTLTKQYPAYVEIDGREQLIGSRPTQYDASLLASDYIIQWYQDNDTPEAAASLIMEELAQEGRHEQLATDMGGVWREPRIDPEVSPSDYMDVTPAYTCDVCGETKPEESFDYQDSDAIVCRSCTPIDPPPCDDKGGCPECDPFQEATEFYAGPPLTMDDAVRLALATSSTPLPGEGRYGHRYPPCPCGGPADHHPQRCNVIGQLLMPGPLPEWKITRAADWERLHAFAASLEKIDPSCPTCGDQVAQEGDFCAACREVGEARYERLLA